MRARTIREGSVGLLILLGVGLFGGLVLWLRGFNPANRPYELIAEFEDTMGVQIGTPVLYRGVSVGRVMSIDPKPNAVEVGLEITEKSLRMPNEVLVETVESGLIGEVSIEISPLEELSALANGISPVGKGCDSSLILCDGDRLAGTLGPSYEELLRSASDLTKLYADPELLAQLKDLLQTVNDTSADAGRLAQEATRLTQQARDEIGPLSNSARVATDSAAAAALQVQATAAEFSLTASELNSLIGENRGVLVNTLDNVQVASLQLRNAADTLGPTLASGELVSNLEMLLANATAASEDLQTITASLNTPTNLVLLQQTLESARDALASAQKVMADVDEITGDPEVRLQIRNLITGLGALVSSTQSLEQETQLAHTLEPLVASGALPMSESEAAFSIDATNALSVNDFYDFGEYDFGETVMGGIAQESMSLADRLASQSNVGPISDETMQRPILVFDGERYVLRSATQLAERPKAMHPNETSSVQDPAQQRRLNQNQAKN
ncbi:MAG: MlaD family protein [Cyanobacteria bacterium P01_F01_bin.3]